jgi:Tfp pilus assembly protein PilN
MLAVIEPNNLNAETEQSPASSTSSRLVIWLVILSSMLLLLPLYLISTTIQQDIDDLELELAGLKATLAYTPPAPPEEQALRETLSQTRNLLNQLDPLGVQLAASHINWPQTIAVIGSYDENLVELTAITQAENRITINGRANNETAVIGYSEILQESGLFTRVIVQSINMRDMPGPTPTDRLMPTPTPTRVAEFTILVELVLS